MLNRALYPIAIALFVSLAAACEKEGDSDSSSGSGPGGAKVGNIATANELSLASQVLVLVNQERANNGGLPPLSNNAAMAQVAYDHSWDMQARSFFSHTNPGGADPFDRLAFANIAYSSAGENIAQGYATPNDVMAAWMASSGHRANILGAYSEIGIGAREGPGGPWWTQVFRQP